MDLIFVCYSGPTLFFNTQYMRSFNKVMLYGNLTSDPEVIPTKDGGTFSAFSLATNRDWKDKDGKTISQTDFHKVVAFKKLGEIVGKYLKRGCPVLVSGRLSNRSYMAKDGNKRYVTEVILDDFNFLSSRKKRLESEQKEATVEVAQPV